MRLFTYSIVFASLLFAHIAFAQNQQCDTTIIKSFRQGSNKKARNCATVSVIKLAVSIYGASNIFSKVDTLNNSYCVVLRNGDTVIITNDELAAAGKADLLELGENTSLYNVARFAYAVMAKHKQAENGASSIKDVLKTFWGNCLLDEDTENNFHFLGIPYRLIDLEKGADVNAIVNTSQFVMASQKHSVFASCGFYDEYGDVEAISDFKTLHGRPQWAFVLLH